MFRVAVCDCEGLDENSRKIINNMISSVLDKIKCEVSFFTYGKDLIASLENEKTYQLVFTAIKLRDMSGAEAVKSLKTIIPDVDVIYAASADETVSEEYGELNADYFIRPVSPSKFRSVLSRRISERFCVYDGFLNVCFQRSMKQIPLHRVYYFERVERKLIARMRGGDSPFCGKFENIEKPLADNGFIRCHKSFIVNIDMIRGMVDNRIILPGNREVAVSISCYDNVRETLRKKKIPIAGSLKK